MITIIQHEKDEWLRMAESAEAQGHPSIAASYRAAAAHPVGSQFTAADFETLQRPYRRWVFKNEFYYRFNLSGPWYAVFKGPNFARAESVFEGEEVLPGEMTDAFLQACLAAKR